MLISIVKSMTSMRRICPEDLSWTELTSAVRYKAAILGSRRVRLVEFATGFAETEWCCAGHIGYVLSGRLEVKFSDVTEVFAAGDIVVIGRDDKHRARVVEGPVSLFLVEEA